MLPKHWKFDLKVLVDGTAPKKREKVVDFGVVFVEIDRAHGNQKRHKQQMRTKTLLIAAVVSAVSMATALAQEVTSVNTVGYVNKELAPGFNLISNPLSSGENTLAEVIPSPPDGSQVWLFQNGQWVSSTFSSLLGGWTEPLNLPVGVGFFFNHAGSEAVTVTFVGEVLQGDDTNKTVPEGLSIQGSLVPQAGALTSDLQFPGADGDVAYSWNGSWTTATFSPILGGWSPEPSLAVGGAVFVDKSAEAQWDRDFTIN